MTFTSVNPHDPADVIGEWEPADDRGVAAVVERARRAGETWRRAPAATRSKALGDAAAAVEQRAAEITALTVREVGKPVSEARGEVARAVSILRYYGQLALLPDGETLPAADPDALLMARYRPVGVAALLTPWNFPVAIPLWKAAPSLTYGNATVLKPSSAAAATALLLHEIIAPHLPEGVFQVLLGGAETARPLIEHPEVAAVSFTGSVPVGRDITSRVHQVLADCGYWYQHPTPGSLPAWHKIRVALSDLPAVEYARAKKALEDRNPTIRAKNGARHATAD